MCALRALLLLAGFFKIIHTESTVVFLQLHHSPLK